MAAEGEPVMGYAFASRNLHTLLELGDSAGSDVYAFDQS